MKMIKDIFKLIWLILLLIPSSVLLYKLTDYLINNNFKNWWITIAWVLILPITFILGFERNKNNE